MINSVRLISAWCITREPVRRPHHRSSEGLARFPGATRPSILMDCRRGVYNPNRLCGSWLPTSSDQPCTDGSPASTHSPVEQRKPRVWTAADARGRFTAWVRHLRTAFSLRLAMMRKRPSAVATMPLTLMPGAPGAFTSLQRYDRS